MTQIIKQQQQQQQRKINKNVFAHWNAVNPSSSDKLNHCGWNKFVESQKKERKKEREAGERKNVLTCSTKCQQYIFF